MVEPNGTMRTYLVLDNGASLNITTSRTLDDDQWHQYVLTVSPLLGAAVYLDGQRHQGNTGFGPGSLDPPGELYIGARSDLDPDRYFGDSASGGSIDEVCVYQGALTAETIAALYEAGVSLRTAVRPPHWTRYDR
jgi:hypothetical protein